MKILTKMMLQSVLLKNEEDFDTYFTTICKKNLKVTKQVSDVTCYDVMAFSVMIGVNTIYTTHPVCVHFVHHAHGLYTLLLQDLCSSENSLKIVQITWHYMVMELGTLSGSRFVYLKNCGRW